MNFVPRTMAEIEDEVARIRGEWPAGLPERFSATQTTMLARCQEQYRQRYVLGIKAPPGAGMILGRADTETIGEHFRKQMAEGYGFHANDIGAFFEARYEGIIDAEGGLMEIQWRRDRVLPRAAAVKMKDAQKKVGMRLARMYREAAADTVHPIGVEAEVLVEQPMWPVPVVGYLDIEEAERVVERKTSGRSVTSPKGDWQAQARIYQLATGKPLSWHVSVTTAEPSLVFDTHALTMPFERQRAHMTVRMVSQAMTTAANNMRDYGPDEPWPDALTHPWACSYCGYEKACAWRR